MDTLIDTIVVGGGQAGLSVSWHLMQAGRQHVILDRGHIGDTWRNRWDSFCLVSPNKLCRLPGFHYDGHDPDGSLHIRLHVDRDGFGRVVAIPGRRLGRQCRFGTRNARGGRVKQADVRSRGCTGRGAMEGIWGLQGVCGAPVVPREG